ncbi:unnamed protein product, partial [Prorocentrum cordatum]
AADFQLAAKAVFMRDRRRARIGVDLRRLQTAAVKYLKRRQSRAVQRCLRKSAAALANGGDQTRSVHMGVGHMWGEVEVKQQWKPSERYRTLRKNMTVPTMIQRGTVNLTLADLRRGQWQQFQEYYLSEPREVTDTRAEGLLPGVRSGLPDSVDIMNRTSVCEILQMVSSMTFMPMCDKASANVLILKTQGRRGKLKMRGLRNHTMRHYSISSLFRYKGQLTKNVAGIERLIEEKLWREVGPAPPMTDTLKHVFDILYTLDATHHQREGRKNGGTGRGESMFLQDLRGLYKLANGSLNREDGKFVHHCWGHTTNKPCCTSRQQCVETMMTAVVHAFHGSADARPAESRWAHLLHSFKRTLTRRLLHRIGLDCYASSVRPEDIDCEQGPQVGVDDEGSDAFWKHVLKVRAKKVKTYYDSEENMLQLVVYTAILETTDANLLYPLMGGAIPTKPDGDCDETSSINSKMDKLLGVGSKISTFSQGMLNLLDSWDTGDPARGHWLLLDIMKAPLKDQQFARWARAQILQMNSVMARRYEARFSAWPCKLYGLSQQESSAALKQAIAQEAHDAPDYMLDSYTLGIRRLFSTTDSMESLECQVVLASDFKAHCYATDMVERLNSECTQKHRARAPGRNSAIASREHVLSQLSNTHQQRGGADPLSATLADNVASDEDAPAQADQLQLAVALDPQTHFEQPVVERRANPSLPFGALVDADGGDSADDQLRRGLNPYLLAKNGYMHSAREAKGRSLTKAEVEMHEEEFKRIWASADQDVYSEAYQLWRQQQSNKKKKPETPECALCWGGGCHATPFTPSELCAYIIECGWPTLDETLDKDHSSRGVPADKETDFASCEGFDCWGVSRAARNADRFNSREPAAFPIVEKSIFNYLQWIGAGRDTAADVMLIVEGPAVSGGHKRYVTLVTDITFSPHVFDVTDHSFEDITSATSE